MDAQVFDLGQFLANVLPTAGVGGVLALVMFYFYRKDAAEHMARFDEILRRQERVSDGWIRIVQDNTVALTKLSERLERK